MCNKFYRYPILLLIGRQPRTLPAASFVLAILVANLFAVPQSALGQLSDARLSASHVQLFCFASPPAGNKRIDQLNPLAHGYGVVIAEDTVLTNRHLLANAETHHYFVAPVDLRGDQALELVPAKPKVLDAWTDLALLKIEMPDATPVEIADTGILTDRNVTLFSPRKSSSTAIARPYPIPDIADAETRFDSLATDSLYQHGGLMRLETGKSGHKSGLGVFNEQGRLIGISTALVPDPAGAPDTIAISLNQRLIAVIERMKSGRLPEFGLLGVTPRDLSNQQRNRVSFGVQVVDVVANSPADAAGLRFSDVITHINDQPVTSAADYFRIIAGSLAGTEVSMQVARGVLQENEVSEKLNRNVTLSKRYQPTRRGSWSSEPPPEWRGMLVEYPFAVPRIQLLTAAIDPQGCVLALDVQIESATWQAGLRPRTIITSVDGKRVRTPDEFFQRVNQANEAAVTLTTVDVETGELVQVVIQPR